METAGRFDPVPPVLHANDLQLAKHAYCSYWVLVSVSFHVSHVRYHGDRLETLDASHSFQSIVRSVVNHPRIGCAFYQRFSLAGRKSNWKLY